MGTLEYERVAEDEDHGQVQGSESKLERDLLEERRRADEREKLRNKLEGLLWLAVSGCILWYGDGKKDFFSVVAKDDRIARSWLTASAVSFGLNCCIFLYLTLWLDVFKKVKADWNESAPHAIPTGTILGIFTYFSFTIAIWPVWYFLSPILTFILLLGFIGSAHYWPTFGAKED